MREKFTFTFTFNCHPGKTHNHRSHGDTLWKAQTLREKYYLQNTRAPFVIPHSVSALGSNLHSHIRASRFHRW